MTGVLRGKCVKSDWCINKRAISEGWRGGYAEGRKVVGVYAGGKMEERGDRNGRLVVDVERESKSKEIPVSRSPDEEIQVTLVVCLSVLCCDFWIVLKFPGNVNMRPLKAIQEDESAESKVGDGQMMRMNRFFRCLPPSWVVLARCHQVEYHNHHAYLYIWQSRKSIYMASYSTPRSFTSKCSFHINVILQFVPIGSREL